MHILFREEAEADLVSIVDYHKQVAHASVQHMLDDIYNTVSILTQFPNAGTMTLKQPYRRIVSSRYHFKNRVSAN